MRRYRIVERHVAEYKQDTRTVCDRCGATIGDGLYDQTEIALEAKVGNVYPENDHRIAYSFDSCATCFLEHVLPAVEALGFKVRKWNNDESEPREQEPEAVVADRAPYSFKTTSTALGTEHTFQGPGMPRHANGVHFMQPMNAWAAKCVAKRDAEDGAESVCRFLNIAFEAGRAAMAEELRELIGARGFDR